MSRMDMESSFEGSQNIENVVDGLLKPEDELVPPHIENEAPPQLPLDSTQEVEQKRSLRTKLALGAAAVSLAFQQSPANEITRGYVGLATLEATGNPLFAGLAFGAATFAIEGTTGVAAATAFRQYSDKIHSAKDKVFSKFKRLSPQEQRKESTPLTDSVLALSVGSAAVVARRHFHDKERTARQDNITVVKAAGAIAVASAAIGYGGAALINAAEGTRFEGVVNGAVDLLSDWRTYAVSAVALGGAAIVKRLRTKENSFDFDAEVKKAEVVDYDKKGFVSLRIDDHESPLAKHALKFEQDIWDKKGYGSLDEYNEKYLDQTRLYATFKDGKCIGTTRVFSGADEENDKNIAPFITEMSYSDNTVQDRLREDYKAGKVEELATSASENSLNTRNVIRSLWRLAYRDSVERGVTHWGIIIEPKRAQLLNKMNAFNFEKLGQPIDYQGGMCSPHLMDLQAVQENMDSKKPDLLKWFLYEKLGTSF